MSLKNFQAAFDALPEGADGEDIMDFLAGVAVSYMPPDEAIRTLFQAAKKVAEYAADVEGQECNCPKCTAQRAAETKH
jgi:hypothetical protein